ncbi:MAG: SMC-Scp complex subunit ScpB [Pirellulales bacterium]
MEELAGGYQLFTRPQFGPWLRKASSVAAETRLSGPAQETLAVVAYRQPIPRAEVEAVRGVQCGDLLRQLLERDLIRIAGRADDLGRPLLYGTTKRFLQVFGLRHLDELPRAEQLRKRPDSPGQRANPDRGRRVEREELRDTFFRTAFPDRTRPIPQRRNSADVHRLR